MMTNRQWFVVGFILGCLAGGSSIYYFLPSTESPMNEQAIPPVRINSETGAQTEYGLVKPEQPGEVTRLINRDNQVFVVVDGQEYELKSDNVGQAVSLGETGTVQITQQAQTKVDLTELFNQRLQDALRKERAAWLAEKTKLNKQNELEIGWSNHGTELRLKKNFNETVTGYVGGTTNGKHYGVGLGIRF